MAPVILCFGDSNTHGTLPMHTIGEKLRLPPEARWPGVLAAALPQARVIEEGLPGRTTLHDDPIDGPFKNGLLGLQIALQTHRPVDLVIVMLGTNDVQARFGLEAIDIARSVERLVGEIRISAAGPEMRAPDVVIVAPVPVAETGILAEMFVRGAEKSRRLTTHLRALAERLGTGFLDAADHARIDMADGVHLDAESHRTLGAALADTVRDRMR